MEASSYPNRISYTAAPVVEHWASPQAIPRKALPGQAAPARRSSQNDPASSPFLKEVDSQDSQPHSILRDWWLEIASCLLVFAALMGIVGITYPYQGKPLPSWPYSISINTLVAAFVTVAKSAMLLVIAEGISHLKWTWFSQRERNLIDLARYDTASRGPWGAIRLLVSAPRRDTIASLGAIVMIASIAMDPFAQQIVHYYPCLWPGSQMSNEASIPRTAVYDYTTGYRAGAGFDTISGDFQASINAGIFSPESNQVSFTCPSGNCTFPDEYRTTAYCGTCTDITSTLIITSHINSDNQTITNYTLPSGFGVVTPNITNLSNTFTYFAVSTAMPSVEILLTPPYTSEYGGWTHTSAECVASGNKSFGCNYLGAASCSLKPCIRTYSGEVKAGKLVERLKETYTSDSFSETPYLDLQCLPPKDLDILKRANYSWTPDQTWLEFDQGYDPRREHTDYPWYPTFASNHSIVILSTTKCTYQFYYWTYNSVYYFLASFFAGSITGDDSTGLNPVSGPNVPLSMYYTVTAATADKLTLTSLDTIFRNMADSMTANMRQNGQKGTNEPVIGYIAQNETCVRVRWAWLAYPAALALFSFVFFVAMLWQSTRGGDGDNARDWKSNPLALLYHGFLESRDGSKEQTGIGTLNRTQGMVQDARGKRVRLTRGSDGRTWSFVELQHE